MTRMTTRMTDGMDFNGPSSWAEVGGLVGLEVTGWADGLVSARCDVLEIIIEIPFFCLGSCAKYQFPATTR